ncbi:hypothetical protein MPSEU_000637400 [Mayamaea pseudoterrestris]|nr:hypothetical protein MPSEU_000637400 [Mayamaea pseudoterrestris]
MNGVTKKSTGPPKFELPADFDSRRYQLWTFRLPQQFDVKELDGTTLQLSGSATIQSNEQSYSMQIANTSETDSFRLLLPKKLADDAVGSDSDDSDSDSSSNKHNGSSNNNLNDELQPSTASFQKHLTIASALRPHEELSTESVEPKVNVRHAYAHVPQRTGLKRRWAPIGGGSVPPIVEASVALDACRSPAKGQRKDESSKRRDDDDAASIVKQELDHSTAPAMDNSLDVQLKQAHKEAKKAKKHKKEKKAKKSKKHD